MREFQLYGLGNALVDIFIEVSDEEFAALGLKRGSTQLVSLEEQQALLKRFEGREPRLVSGGSLANSVVAFAQLGGQAAFLGCVGDDRYGLFYQAEFEELGIDIGNPVVVGQSTGTCLCLIAPDAERTMCTALGVSSQLAARHVDERRLKNADWLFLEGYTLATPQTGQSAIREAVRLARLHDVRVALTCSEAFVVHVSGEVFFEILDQSDLLFCNASEACAVTGAASAEKAFAALAGKVPSALVTDGPHGAYVRHAGVETHVPAFPCQPVDLTGAGDMVAGAFLYGIIHGLAPDRAARAACFLATKVICQVGARLHHGTRRFWDECLSNLSGPRP
ncbi:MAG: adenosine kinase [Gemmataceae bacterium]